MDLDTKLKGTENRSKKKQNLDEGIDQLIISPDRLEHIIYPIIKEINGKFNIKKDKKTLLINYKDPNDEENAKNCDYILSEIYENKIVLIIDKKNIIENKDWKNNIYEISSWFIIRQYVNQILNELYKNKDENNGDIFLENRISNDYISKTTFWSSFLSYLFLKNKLQDKMLKIESYLFRTLTEKINKYEPIKQYKNLLYKKQYLKKEDPIYRDAENLLRKIKDKMKQDHILDYIIIKKSEIIGFYAAKYYEGLISDIISGFKEQKSNSFNPYIVIDYKNMDKIKKEMGNLIDYTFIWLYKELH